MVPTCTLYPATVGPITGLHARVAVEAAGGGGGLDGETTKRTGTLFVDCFPTLIVMVVLYVPVASPVGLTATVSWPEFVIEVVAGDTVNHEADSEFDKLV